MQDVPVGASSLMNEDKQKAFLKKNTVFRGELNASDFVGVGFLIDSPDIIEIEVNGTKAYSLPGTGVQVKVDKLDAYFEKL